MLLYNEPQNSSLEEWRTFSRKAAIELHQQVATCAAILIYVRSHTELGTGNDLHPIVTILPNVFDDLYQVVCFFFQLVGQGKKVPTWYETSPSN